MNQGFGKDFYRKGNSVKRFGPFTEPPDSENLKVAFTEPPDSENLKVAVLIPCPKIGSYLGSRFDPRPNRVTIVHLIQGGRAKSLVKKPHSSY